MFTQPLAIPHVALLVALSVSLLRAAPNPQSPEVNATSLLTEHSHELLDKDSKGASLRQLALTHTLENQLLNEAYENVSSEAIANHYHRFQHHFHKPEALELWRLLVATREQALELLDKVQKSNDRLRTWSTLVREHSLDKATHFRRGSLGFVWPDGNTDVPQVRVSPELFAAASSLEDGQLAREPIKEGTAWALLWRRDTRKATGRSLARAQAQIRQQLALASAKNAYAQLVQELRARSLLEYHPEHLESFVLPSEAPPPRRNAPIGSRPARSSPTPRPTDLGDR